MAPSPQITNQIRRLRFEAGEMTQQHLAERAGVTRQTIIAIEQATSTVVPRGRKQGPARAARACRYWALGRNRAGRHPDDGGGAGIRTPDTRIMIPLL